MRKHRDADTFMMSKGRDFQRPREAESGKEANDAALSPRPVDWSEYLDSTAAASDEFMEDVDDLPPKEPSL